MKSRCFKLKIGRQFDFRSISEVFVSKLLFDKTLSHAIYNVTWLCANMFSESINQIEWRKYDSIRPHLCKCTYFLSNMFLIETLILKNGRW